MKKLLSLLSIVILVLSTTGCVSTKKIRYFQGSDEIYAQAQRVMQQYEMRLKPADQVYIKLTCSDEKLLEDFAVCPEKLFVGNAVAARDLVPDVIDPDEDAHVIRLEIDEIPFDT